MSVRSEMVRSVRAAVLCASCCAVSACGSAHSAADAGERDSAGLDGAGASIDVFVFDAAGSDSGISVTDSSSDVGGSLDADEGPDVFVCRATDDVCTFAWDCCSGVCILKPGGDGICV
jgi:hypothetical protein